MSLSGARPMRPPSTVNTLRRWAPSAEALALMTSKVRYMEFARRGSASDVHGHAAEHDLTPVRSRVAHTRGRLAPDFYRRGSFGDGVRRTRTDAHVAHHSGGNTCNQYRRHTGSENGSPHV